MKVLLSVLIVLGLMRAAVAQEQPAPPAERQQVGDYTLSGPYVHENLAIYLVHGRGALPGKQYLTLDEALAAKKAVMHETGNVSELAVENLDPELDLYISAGDIVKGGQQDRTIAQDLIVKPNSGRVPIGSFCVEQGRWSRRGNEAVAGFASSSDALAGKQLKLAARLKADQGEVWEAVSNSQQQLTEKLGDSVRSAESASSLQLTLENAAVVRNVESYTTILGPLVERHADAIGYAFAINGQINSVDIYANAELFRKLWPKLLKSTAVEALADGTTTTQPAAPATLADLESTITAADRAKGEQKALNDRTQMRTNNAEESVLFETRDAAAGNEGYVRRNYIAK